MSRALSMASAAACYSPVAPSNDAAKDLRMPACAGMTRGRGRWVTVNAGWHNNADWQTPQSHRFSSNIGLAIPLHPRHDWNNQGRKHANTPMPLPLTRAAPLSGRLTTPGPPGFLHEAAPGFPRIARAQPDRVRGWR